VAKFAGKCGFCKRPINPGDRAGYEKTHKRTLCYRCAETEYESESMRQMERMKLA
jgi:hypothetical protein